MMMNTCIKYIHKCLRSHHYNTLRLCSTALLQGSNNEAIKDQKYVEDLSNVSPYFPISFNIAAYVNSSITLQNLVQMNVNLSKIEKKPHIAEKLLKLDFDRDMKTYIVFLSDYVDMENIGQFLTKNPMIFLESLEDLKVRINYLKSKRFNGEQIRHIILNNPFWLLFSTSRIDRRIGYFQEKFNLTGKETRLLVTRKPKLITYNFKHVECNSFIIKEEMGYEDKEIKQLLLHKPKLWMINDKALIQRFNYIHNVMKISHEKLLESPDILLCRNFRLKQRHLFLESLGRAQYDHTKENYVPLKGLVDGTDVEFCKKYAKCNVNDFNDFLKTL